MTHRWAGPDRSLLRVLERVPEEEDREEGRPSQALEVLSTRDLMEVSEEVPGEWDPSDLMVNSSMVRVIRQKMPKTTI